MDKPAFDPTQPFDTVSEKPAFDPSKPFEPADTKAEPRSMSDVASSAVSNIGPSALQFGHDIIQPFIHPVETYDNLKNLGMGIAEKTGISSGDEHVKYADAAGKYLADRYGGVENLKNTLANDPVGLAADLSMLISGGGTAAARMPGYLGKAGEIAGSVGRAMDPVAGGAKVVKGIVGDVIPHVVGELGTGTGADSIRLAARSGYEGGESGRSFRENMRGGAEMEDAVTEARKALGNIRQERGKAYRDSMADIGKDPTILDFDKVDNALVKIAGVKTYKGQIISPSTQAIRNEIGTAIKDWKALDPAEFHTVEGMDALKQKIGDIRDAAPYGTPDRVVADQAYHAIRNTIVEQAPEYAKTMKGYEEASKQIKDIEKTLSLNPNASIDTALRKLQSVLRNNVNTNYGRRADLADYLVNAGAPNLMQKLAGQAMSSWTPRGLGKLGMQLMTEFGAMGLGAAAAGTGGAGLAAAATLPFMSPRLVGEVAHKAGQAARYPGKVISKIPARTTEQSALQLGRVNDLSPSKP